MLFLSSARSQLVRRRVLQLGTAQDHLFADDAGELFASYRTTPGGRGGSRLRGGCIASQNYRAVSVFEIRQMSVIPLSQRFGQ